MTFASLAWISSAQSSDQILAEYSLQIMADMRNFLTEKSSAFATFASKLDVLIENTKAANDPNCIKSIYFV